MSFLASVISALVLQATLEGSLVRDLLFAASGFVLAPAACIAWILGFEAVRRPLVVAIVLVPFMGVVGVILFFGAAVVEAGARGPYTSWYNHSKERRAEAAGLVGLSESRVIAVLGQADYVWRSWDRETAATGELLPAPGAKLVSTYNYAPYPLLPLSKFQVHCWGGVVRNIEVFDD